jgi:hypothetical protein
MAISRYYILYKKVKGSRYTIKSFESLKDMTDQLILRSRRIMTELVNPMKYLNVFPTGFNFYNYDLHIMEG